MFVPKIMKIDPLVSEITANTGTDTQTHTQTHTQTGSVLSPL